MTAEQRRTELSKPPKSKRRPNVAIRCVVTPEGTFKPSTEASREYCRACKLYAGVELIMYAYQPRSLKNWDTAHGFGNALVQHVEGFEGLTAHQALKKLQVDGRIAVEVEKVEIKGFDGHLDRIVPLSLAFDEMDENEFQAVYKRMVEYVRMKYWPTLDEAGMAGLQRLLGMGS